MGNITSIFGTDFTPPPESRRIVSSIPPDQQLIQEIESYGYTPPSQILADGRIHRFSTNGKRGDKSGWYICHSGAIYAGAFGDWRQDSSIAWRQDIGRELSAVEQMEYAARMKRIKDEAAEARKRTQESTAESVGQIIASAADATSDHPYLIRKQVGAYGLKISGDGRLIVPMVSQQGAIVSAQYIPETGDKKYHPGGEAAGCYHVIHGSTDCIYIAEGYATAASIHEATGATCFVAFSAGQLSSVVGFIRESYTGDLVIVADHDDSGIGQRKALEAAQAHKARVIMPPVQGMDANDYAVAGYDLAALLNPPADDWLTPADEFCSQPKPIQWLIKGFMQREALHMIHGPSGGGKTFFVLDQMLHVAAGFDDWHGQKVRGGPVVYLAGEGHHGLRGRIAAWKQRNGHPSLNMWLSKAGTDLNTPEGYSKARSALLALPECPSVIVVDTLHRFLDGDENSAKDAKTMLDACGSLQNEFGCGIILVHHTGVSDEAQHRARGSSAWRGALDIEISVVPGGEDKPMEIVCRKMKDGEPFKSQYYKIAPIPLDGWFDEDGEQVFSAVLEPASAAEVKKGRPESDHERTFKDAWRDSGQELAMGCPYVSRSALAAYLVSRCEISEKSVDQYLKPSVKSKIIGSLTEAGRIQKHASGWILVQDGMEASLSILGATTV